MSPNLAIENKTLHDDIIIYFNRAYLKPNINLDHTFILLFVLTSSFDVSFRNFNPTLSIKYIN